MLRLDPSDSSAQPHSMIRSARRTSLGSATAIGMSFAVFLWSPGAMAAAGCTTTGLTVQCTSVGEESISIPSGATSVTVTLVGGGGAGGKGGGSGDDAVAGANGGSGASVAAKFTLPQGATLLDVKVGAGGTGGTGGGEGGDFSRIETNSGVLLAIAGGGGGGGFANPNATGGNGGSSQTGAGGDGSDSGGASGGSGGSAGLGGAAGGGLADPGSDYADGAGDGGYGDGGSGGYGGNGYGGGGGGDSFNSSRGGGGAGGSYANPEFVTGSAAFATATGVEGSGGEGGADGTSSGNGESGQSGLVTITFIIIPTPSTESSASAPRAISLDFTLPTGIECRFDSVEASLGSWIELPSANDCTITDTRATDSDPTLLGWATNADFPIDIAQRQVDNGWGAYETFNSDGQLTGVFIPAGGYTLLSNDTNLYPIWAN